MKQNTLILASSVLLMSNTFSMAADEKKPNILIFIADDLGWEEVGAYGHPVVKTPNIDWLASQGMRFDNFYLTASSSSPSRSSIFTGMYPSCTGARNLHENMPAYINMFPDRLHEKGYYTMLVGKTHGTNLPAVQKRFDYGSFIDWSKPWTMVDLWKDALKQRPKDKPFFMFAASIDPHRPFKQGEYEKPYLPDEVVVPPYLQDSPEMREELADYYNEISRFDNHVGQVLKLLREEGELENTFIIVMSDNGRAFQQSKTRVNMQGIKSPFIVYYPPLIKQGVVTESLASAVDIAPTLLDIAKVKRAAGLQGVSLLPVLKEPEAEVRKYAFAEHNWHVFKAYERALITKEYIYIRNWLPQLSNPVVVEVMTEPSYKTMLSAYEKGELPVVQQDCFISPRPEEELFYTIKDIHCLNNIANKKSMRKMKEKLNLILETWQMSIGDVFDESKLKQDTSDRITGKTLKR
ncbi:sulfatase [Bacteroides sp. GM023]|uniref:sulfatase family protein n=1 Tax=Bacteroides sp. GM023 TaxID=2723058 RepID=UPI00168A4042|nr:sulfatase [Bacteroides sp. GM023]MBD3592385.1 sulfatase [Bacteroides sp. GM023]